MLCQWTQPRVASSRSSTDGLPRSGSGGSADEFGLVVAVHGLSERVILAVADGPDRGCGADLGEAFPVADRGELTTGMAVATQVVVAGAAAPAGHLDGVEDVSVRT